MEIAAGKEAGGIDLRRPWWSRLLVEDSRVVGVVETLGPTYRARAVLITTGTF